MEGGTVVEVESVVELETDTPVSLADVETNELAAVVLEGSELAALGRGTVDDAVSEEAGAVEVVDVEAEDDATDAGLLDEGEVERDVRAREVEDIVMTGDNTEVEAIVEMSAEVIVMADEDMDDGGARAEEVEDSTDDREEVVSMKVVVVKEERSVSVSPPVLSLSSCGTAAGGYSP